ncbi:FAD-binding oxidoreductase [Allokutzneria multivorans]|uniref:FAD-binding oxidoreductase n=1 Tax=Allokutzneria multivorans TaxID=1142134 RepID=A0ABP7SPC0_9PSEU
MRIELGLLRMCLTGTVLTPGEPGYEAECRSWNLAMHQRPAFAVSALTEQDVAAAVRFAYVRDLPVGVMCTGRGLPRPCDDGVLVNTGGMRGVRVDPGTETAWVQAGARWQDVIDEAQRYGLAPLSGFATHDGAVGSTLSGGMGWLTRRYGVSAASVVGARVVLADGELVETGESRHPELVWALRGGGGNFGVVTELRLRLYPVTEVFGGGVYYPIETAGQVMEAYREWVRELPPEVSSSVCLTRRGSEPGGPEPLRGRWVIGVRACHSGDRQDAERLLKPLRSLEGVLLDTFGPMTYDRISEIAMLGTDPNPHVSFGMVLPELTEAACAALLMVAGPERRAPYDHLELRHIGGGNEPEEADAGLGIAGAEFVLHSSMRTPVADEVAAAQRFYSRLARGLAPFASERTTLNFLGPANTEPDRVRRSYRDDHYQRLQRIKGLYDPHNVFRFNHNIPPAA